MSEPNLRASIDPAFANELLTITNGYICIYRNTQMSKPHPNAHTQQIMIMSDVDAALSDFELWLSYLVRVLQLFWTFAWILEENHTNGRFDIFFMVSSSTVWHFCWVILNPELCRWFVWLWFVILLVFGCYRMLDRMDSFGSLPMIFYFHIQRCLIIWIDAKVFLDKHSVNESV
jgi:hypothetical protein